MAPDATKQTRKKHPPIKVGDRFGRRVIISCSISATTGKTVCDCVCDCGRLCIGVAASQLKEGKSSSCGCLIREKTIRRLTTHGMCHTREYGVWTSMIERCTNEKHEYWHHYGGRGITVCQEWRDSFEAFYADMGERPPGMTLERIRNNEGYCKDNCRWETPVRQARNRRTSKIIDYQGRSQCLADWAEELGIRYGNLQNRLNDGWSIERAFTEPVGDPNRRRTARIVEFRGRSMCLADWSRELGIDARTLASRLNKGWPLEKVFDEPVGDPRNHPGSHLIEYQGRSMCITGWAKEIGISYAALDSRLKRGWPVEKAFTEPLAQPGKRRKAAPANS